MLVISANGHAWAAGIRPDYIFCKDHRHTETGELMELLVRFDGVPVVTQHHWADYRAAGWPVQGNSGMMALALAALMGCAPIIPVGFDCFLGPTYFHAPAQRNVSLGRPPGYWKSRIERLKGRLEGAAIRPISGPLLQAFKRYHPGETIAPPEAPRVFDPYRGVETTYVRAVKRFVMQHDARVEVPVGYVFPAMPKEAAAYVRGGVAVDVGRTPTATVDFV